MSLIPRTWRSFIKSGSYPTLGRSDEPMGQSTDHRQTIVNELSDIAQNPNNPHDIRDNRMYGTHITKIRQSVVNHLLYALKPSKTSMISRIMGNNLSIRPIPDNRLSESCVVSVAHVQNPLNPENPNDIKDNGEFMTKSDQRTPLHKHPQSGSQIKGSTPNNPHDIRELSSSDLIKTRRTQEDTETTVSPLPELEQIEIPLNSRIIKDWDRMGFVETVKTVEGVEGVYQIPRMIQGISSDRFPYQINIIPLYAEDTPFSALFWGSQSDSGLSLDDRGLGVIDGEIEDEAYFRGESGRSRAGGMSCCEQRVTESNREIESDSPDDRLKPEDLGQPACHDLMGLGGETPRNPNDINTLSVVGDVGEGYGQKSLPTGGGGKLGASTHGFSKLFDDLPQTVINNLIEDIINRQDTPISDLAQPPKLWNHDPNSPHTRFPKFSAESSDEETVLFGGPTHYWTSARQIGDSEKFLKEVWDLAAAGEQVFIA